MPPPCPIAVRVALDPVTVLSECSSVNLDPWQNTLARGKNDVFVCNSRQTGKSFAACIALLSHVLSENDRLAVCISPTQRQSGLILRTCRKLLLKIPPMGRPRVTKDTVTQISLSNGSSIMALPSGAVAGGSNLRGLSPSLMVIEEAAFLPDSLYFDVLSPMMAVTSGRTLIITSPNACTGWAYDLFNSGSMTVIEVKAEDCKRISKKYLERKQREMPKAAFLREFCCRWIALGAGVFDPDAIERAFQIIPDNPMREFL
jgi:hypothetical protein